MLEKQTFNLKTVAGSSKIARSKSSGWKEKCFQAQLRQFVQKMKMLFHVGVINVIVYLWKKKLIIMKTAMTNSIMILMMTTSVTVICQVADSDDGNQ